MVRHALPVAALLIAGLVPPASAQGAPPPMGEAEITTGSVTPADEAFDDIDPALIAQCRTDAHERRLIGEVRTRFLRLCVMPED